MSLLEEMRVILLLLLLQYCSAVELISCNNGSNVGDFICKINENYDKTRIPGKLPLNLHPVLDIHDILEVNEVEGLVTIYLTISVGWIDEGLLYKNRSM